MSRDHFWLTDKQFARIAPHLPTGTRGKPRIDDRRVISGIVHVLKSGARWVDAPSLYGPRKTLYNRYVRWAAKGGLGEPLPCACAGRGSFGAAPHRQFGREGPPLLIRGQRGELDQAI